MKREKKVYSFITLSTLVAETIKNCVFRSFPRGPPRRESGEIDKGVGATVYPALLPPRNTLKREIVGRAVKGQGRAISCTSKPPSLSDYVPKNREGNRGGSVGRNRPTQDGRYNGGLLLGTILDDGSSRAGRSARRSFRNRS